MSERPESPPSAPWLRARDQLSVGVLVASALVLMAALWWRNGGVRGGLVEIDRAPPLVAKFQVDVNRADWPELIHLPGIGQTIAEKWIAERERNGRFHNLDDLARVPGIGPRTLAKIRPYLAPVPNEAAWAGN